MNSGIVLIFKISIDSNSVVDIFKYTGYLVDIDNNRSYKEYYSTEQSSSTTDFGILEKMTKKLLKSYQKSNS